jgi:hypothetical protein
VRVLIAIAALIYVLFAVFAPVIATLAGAIDLRRPAV